MWLLLTIAMLGAVPATAQTEARARAILEVGEVLALRVLPGGGVEARSADGVYRELTDAVRLDITANRSWQLTVRTESGGAVASLSGVGSPQRALWYRVAEAEAGVRVAGSGYMAVDGGETPVATGGPGSHLELWLDYRWLEGAGEGVGPGAAFYFTLSPR